MKHRKGVAYRCPSCGKNIDCHHNVNGEHIQPSVEDILVCGSCKAIMEVIDSRQGIARILTKEEYEELPAEITKSLEFVMSDWENQKRKMLSEW